MDITFQNVLWTALGLIGTTTLAILVTRPVNWLLDRRSALVVEVRVNELFESRKLLAELTQQMWSVVPKWEDRRKLPFQPDDKYTKFFRCETYLKIAAKNNTPKKLTGLTVSFDRIGDFLLQIDQGDMIEIDGKAPTALVDLQPGRSIVVHVLADSSLYTGTNDLMRARILFSSDEHVRVRYKFPASDNIEFAMKTRRNAISIVLVAVLSLGATIGLGILSSHQAAKSNIDNQKAR